MLELSVRLKAFADYIGSARELALLMDMKPQSLQVYIKGKSAPGAQILVKLYQLGCNINWLLTGEGNMLRDNFKPIKKKTIEEKLDDILTELSDTKRRLSYLEQKKSFKADVAQKPIHCTSNVESIVLSGAKGTKT